MSIFDIYDVQTGDYQTTATTTDMGTTNSFDNGNYLKSEFVDSWGKMTSRHKV